MHAQDVLPQLWSLAIDQSINLIAGIVILCAGWMLANAAARWTRAGLGRVRYMDPTLKPLIASLARYAILVFTLMAVLERFGVRTTSLIAILGAAGLAVGLALQGTFSNVASGVLLLLLRTFRVGEEISAGGCSGTVREIGLFRTVIITGDGLYVSMPNSTIFSANIVNNSREPNRRVSFEINVDHTADVGKALTLAVQVAKSNKRVLNTPEPAASVSALGDSEATIQVSAWTGNGDHDKAASEIKRAIRERFRDEQIHPPHQLVRVASSAGISEATQAAATQPAWRQKSA